MSLSHHWPSKEGQEEEEEEEEEEEDAWSYPSWYDTTEKWLHLDNHGFERTVPTLLSVQCIWIENSTLCRVNNKQLLLEPSGILSSSLLCYYIRLWAQEEEFRSEGTMNNTFQTHRKVRFLDARGYWEKDDGIPWELENTFPLDLFPVSVYQDIHLIPSLFVFHDIQQLYLFYDVIDVDIRPTLPT